MTPDQERAAKAILDAMLELPWVQRPLVWATVRGNAVFCVECGYGEAGAPHPRCHCTNDE